MVLARPARRRILPSATGSLGAPPVGSVASATPPPNNLRAKAAIQRARRMLEKKGRQQDYRGVAAYYLKLGDAYLACGQDELAQEAYRDSLHTTRLLDS